jgi:hypothetical protein
LHQANCTFTFLSLRAANVSSALPSHLIVNPRSQIRAIYRQAVMRQLPNLDRLAAFIA